MDSDPTPESPFEPGFAPEPPRSPFEPGSVPQPAAAEDVVGSRLGISHLMVATACVAVYLGFSGLTMTRYWEENTPAHTFFWTTEGISGGIALAGLVLWAARRRRNVPFPVLPGEYLWACLGLNALFGLSIHTMLMCLFAAQESEHVISSFATLFGGLQYLRSFLAGLVFLWATLGVERGRWRLLFLAGLSVHAAAMLTCCEGFYAGGMLRWYTEVAMTAVADLVLVALVLLDRPLWRIRPWTHWAGVGVTFWAGATYFSWFAWWWIVERPQM